MRAGAIAAGLVAVALAGSLGLVFAQKGSLTALPWGKSAAVAENTGGATSDPTAAKANARSASTPASEPAKQVAAQQPMKMAASEPAAPAKAEPAPLPSAAAVIQGPPCTNPDALGVSRVVEIDTTAGPGFGFEHFKQYDFLQPGEVVLTFDDGPWLNNTPAVLKALADQCVRATFFPIGKHATYYPEILKEVYEAGHTIGSHTWSHQDLSKKSVDEGKEEIEKGVSAVKFALGHPIAPFFRFPALRHPPEMVAYLGERNVGIFSTDIDSFDFKIRKPEQIVKSLMAKLKKHGKGILLMHDFQHGTSQAVPELLAELKANGYKIVHLVPKGQLDSLAQYDEELAKDKATGPVTGGGRPTSSVVKTIGQ